MSLMQRSLVWLASATPTGTTAALTYDEAGPELSRVLWLTHVGEQVETQRQWARLAIWLFGVALVAGGLVMQRRRAVRVVQPG